MIRLFSQVAEEQAQQPQQQQQKQEAGEAGEDRFRTDVLKGHLARKNKLLAEQRTAYLKVKTQNSMQRVKLTFLSYLGTASPQRTTIPKNYQWSGARKLGTRLGLW